MDSIGMVFYIFTHMETENINQSIIQETIQLLDKTAVESVIPVIVVGAPDANNQEALLISLKSINARYDKQDAIAQVQGLMQRYNIQIDELMDLIKG